MQSPARDAWGSRIGLVLAAAGNAVGLGNFLRFPAQAARNGGGAFMIPYLISFVLIGLPLLWLEWALGRYGGTRGHHSTPGMLDAVGKRRFWKYLGVFGLFTNLAIAAYYCYIESWTLAYVFHSLSGTFAETKPADFFASYVGTDAGGLWTFSIEALLFLGLTLALNLWILSRGLARGVEMASKIGMPLLIAFGAILALRGLTLAPSAPGVVQSPLDGLNFVWNPDFGAMANPSVWLAAAGQIFFTLSVGMGSLHCYASYLKKDDDVALPASAAGWTNEFVEVLLGGSILIPIATAYLGLEAVRAATQGGSGFGLGFMTLPSLFQNWGALAPLAGAMWFGLLFLAGITSSLAMGQPVIAFFQDELRMSRRNAVLWFGGMTALLAVPCVFLYGRGAFDEFDFWAGTFSLVVFALVETVAFVWIFGREKSWQEIVRGAGIRIPPVFRFVMAWVTPLLLSVIFVAALVRPAGDDWLVAASSLAAGSGWALNPESVIGKVLHVGAADPENRWVLDGTRLLLSATYLALCALVYFAWKRRRESPRDRSSLDFHAGDLAHHPVLHD